MSESDSTVTSARVPLTLPRHFSWRAVALVLAEKFGLRGLRIAFMIAAPVVYFAAKGCNSILCSIVYVGAGLTVVLFIIVVWNAKEALDKFAERYAEHAFLTLDAHGVGGEAGAERFSIPWPDFRRVVEKDGCWLLETKQGAWMVLPTTSFTREAWQIMREHRKAFIKK